ncbi:MAG TPA: alpha/beta hydrolase [Acidimicrobiales bacterium]
MPRAPANGIELEYETFGDDGAPAVLLVAGWGSQLITWHHDFCAALAERGYRVIRFDNRDVGLSSKIEDGSAYTLEDMADDAAGLLDALGVDRAHVIGHSMGGMIGQTLAIHHPHRVASLMSMGSTTGAPDVGGADPGLLSVLNRLGGETRDERIDIAIAATRATWRDTPQFPFDEEMARYRAETSVDRAYYPVGKVRQVVAIHASGDRTLALRQLRVPALVVHGDNDPLIDVSGGEATADAIPGAELVIVEGLGHVVDRRIWPRLLDAFDRLVARATVSTTTGR